jgi:hypothetical protein
MASLLDSGMFLLISLEAWLTRRTIVEAGRGAEAQPRMELAGSDQRAYEQVVINFIGAWENTLRRADSIYGWAEAAADPARLWSALSESWPFLERHLRIAAYFLTSAVWNEDPIGAERYRDALLRCGLMR